MRVLIIDFFNLVKRYTYSYKLEDMEPGEIIDKLTFNILNRICDVIYESQPDIIVTCSDSGFNKRAASAVEGYKANRKRSKSLTDEEKEKDYIEYLKSVMATLPMPFIEIKDTEADLLIMCLIKYLRKLDPKIAIILASSDSDMLQILDNNTKIIDWYKGDVTVENWHKKHEKHGVDINLKNYAIGKSIVGDASDNIKGVMHWGWKKVSRLFTTINSIYGKDLVFDNANVLINYIYEALNSNYNIDSKTIEFLESSLEMLNENKKFINNNLSIIDLTLLETPYMFQINSLIERSLFENKITFNKKEFLELLKLDRYGYDEEEYKKILAKNSKSSAIFYYISKKANIAISTLKNKRSRVIQS